MEPVFANRTFSKPVYEQAAHKLVDTGGGIFSHPVGMAVHDDGDYSEGPLKPGQVFSIDPQLRVPEEHLYYRYEDVIVITTSGYENFTEFLPTIAILRHEPSSRYGACCSTLGLQVHVPFWICALPPIA